jgi:hypothetical protein
MTDMRDNHQLRPKARFPRAFSGMLVAQAIWGLSVVATYLGTDLFAPIATPVGAIGWFLIWGDNTWPEWARSPSLHIVFGLCFYGLIGALFGLWLNRPFASTFVPC